MTTLEIFGIVCGVIVFAGILGACGAGDHPDEPFEDGYD